MCERPAFVLLRFALWRVRDGPWQTWSTVTSCDKSSSRVTRAVRAYGDSRAWIVPRREPATQCAVVRRSKLRRYIISSSHCLVQRREAKLLCRFCLHPSHQQPLLIAISYSLWRGHYKVSPGLTRLKLEFDTLAQHEKQHPQSFATSDRAILPAARAMPWN